MTAAGELTTVEVDGATYYIEPRTLDELPSIRREQKLRLLNPFDGLVINRKRLERLFGFRYALECYKKPDQREFGYYTLPLLRGEEFLGRLDAKADRKRKKLVLRGLWWEDGAPDSAELKRELRTELERLAAFNGCEDIEERLD